MHICLRRNDVAAFYNSPVYTIYVTACINIYIFSVRMIMHPPNGITDKFSRVNNDTRVAHASRLSLNISTVHLYRPNGWPESKESTSRGALSTRFSERIIIRAWKKKNITHFPNYYKPRPNFYSYRIYFSTSYDSSRRNRPYNGTRWNNGNANSNHGFTRRALWPREILSPQKFCRLFSSGENNELWPVSPSPLSPFLSFLFS